VECFNTNILTTIVNINRESTKDNFLLPLIETFKELFLANSSANLVLIKSANFTILLFRIFTSISYIKALSLLKLFS
jgi:hypothetical protein